MLCLQVKFYSDYMCSYKMSSPVSCLLISLCLVLRLTVSLVWGQTPTGFRIGVNDVVTPGSTIPMTTVGAGGLEVGLGLSALACVTPSASTAVWLFPDGNIVPPRTQEGFTAPPNTIQSLRQNSAIITLHRGEGYITGGEYCCGSETNVNERLCVTLASCPLLALDNGVVTYTDPPVDNAHNSITANHKCLDGYLLVGDSIRICDISGGTGIWRGEHRTCNVLCSLLTAPTNGGISYSDDKRGMGTVTTYSCDAGYGLVGDLIRICVSADTWSGAEPTCEASEVDCGPLSNPANGQVDISPGTSINSVATYSCYTGYHVTGESTRVCTANGQWTPAAPTCVAVDCGIPPNPPNGYVNTSTGTVFNSLAMYNCDVGYMLDGNSLSICGPDRMWAPGTPTCPKVDCGPLHDPDHGMVDTTRGTTYNSRATYTCDRGYIRNGTDSCICQPDGMWSATEPVCYPVDCGALYNPKNGTVDTSAGTTLGHNATHRCNTGYRRRGSMFSTCNADGIWTPSKPSCDPVDCGSLSHPENGRVDTSLGTTYQKESTYSCDVGYTLLGTVSRRCTASGQWLPDAPYCHIVDCGQLLNPEKGHVNTSSGTTYNRVAFYTCVEGYVLVGEPERHCDPDGMWTPSAPSCVPVDCGPLRQPKNGVVNTIPDTYLNSTATYSCNPGYNLTGNAQRVCQSNGSWSSSPPYCADSAMVQVKFGPTSHCVEWSESRVELMYKMLRESIFKAIVQIGGQPIAVDKISKGYFSCYSSMSRTTYRTTISGLENTSAVHLAELVQKWVESGVSMRALWYVIKIDKSCPVLILSVDDDECA